MSRPRYELTTLLSTSNARPSASTGVATSRYVPMATNSSSNTPSA